MKALCLVSLVLMSAVAIGRRHQRRTDRRTLYQIVCGCLLKNRYSAENAGLTVHNLPLGTTKYHKRDTILAPKFTGGYRFRSLVDPLSYSCNLDPARALRPRVRDLSCIQRHRWTVVSLAAVVSKEFALPHKFKVEPKVGVARSWFEHSIGLDETRTNKFTIAETRPFASLGIRRQVTPRMSAGVELSNYFLEKTEPVSTLTFGLRCNF